MGLSLVYHAGALGDFITTLPAMSAWRRLHPEDRIVLLGIPAFAELAPEGLFDEVWEARSSRFAPLFSGRFDAGSFLRGRFPAFDSALLFSAAASRLAANLAQLGVREATRQDPFPSERVHSVDYHLSLFAGLALAEEDRRPAISRGRGKLAVPPDAVALHPGSGDPRKNWPLEKFHSLAEKLEDAGFTVRWIVGPAEEGLTLPVGGEAWRNAPLTDIAAALAACRLFVGNDSGMSHLAAAAGCPTVALFGATDPVVWAPRGQSVRVLKDSTGVVQALSVGTVLSECLGALADGKTF